MDEHGLTLFHLEKEDFNLKLKKGADADDIRAALGEMTAPAAAFPTAPAAPPVAAPAGETPAGETPEEPADSGREIASPMVGTFYGKPTPEAEAFVNVGDTVSQGDVLCIIEAMKVMNEIKADCSGTITEICVEDSTPVQFGDMLFRLK